MDPGRYLGSSQIYEQSPVPQCIRIQVQLAKPLKADRLQQALGTLLGSTDNKG